MSTDSTPPAQNPAEATQAFEGQQAPETQLPPEKKGGGVKRIVVSVLALIVIVGGGFAVRYFLSDAANAKAGECVSVAQQSGDKVDVKSIDCGEDKATYKVGKVLDNATGTCPDGGVYDEVTPATSVGSGYKLCLMPNFVEGSCYTPDQTGAVFNKAACSGAETIKVAKVINGSSDTAECPEGAGMSYPEPAVTFCLAPAEG
jgi:hypothetical protein